MLLEIALSLSAEAANVLAGLLRQHKVGIEKPVLLGVGDGKAFGCVHHSIILRFLACADLSVGFFTTARIFVLRSNNPLS